MKVWCSIVVLGEKVVIKWNDIVSELLWLVLGISFLFRWCSVSKPTVFML